MAFDIRYYKNKPEGHEDKTYEYLMETMTRTIATERGREEQIGKTKRSKSNRCKSQGSRGRETRVRKKTSRRMLRLLRKQQMKTLPQ